MQPAATAAFGGNRKRNVLIGAAVATVLAVVGVIVGVTVGGGDDSSDIPPELAGVADTQLEMMRLRSYKTMRKLWNPSKQLLRKNLQKKNQ